MPPPDPITPLSVPEWVSDLVSWVAELFGVGDGGAEGFDPLPAGEESRTYSVDDYVAEWEEVNGRPMTATERQVLAAGCIGVTAVNLGLQTNPPLDESYAELNQALARREELQKADPSKEYRIFSKRFYSAGKDYTPDPSTGKVDMSHYDHTDAKPGLINFDYGWFDEQTDSWWHANHSEPGMEVYQSTEEYYSRPLRDFDEQVYVVAPVE